MFIDPIIIELLAGSASEAVQPLIETLPAGHAVRELLTGPHGWVGGLEPVRRFYELLIAICGDRLERAAAAGWLRRPEDLSADECRAARDWLASAFPADAVINGRRAQIFVIFGRSLESIRNAAAVLSNFDPKSAGAELSHWATAMSLIRALMPPEHAE